MLYSRTSIRKISHLLALANFWCLITFFSLSLLVPKWQTGMEVVMRILMVYTATWTLTKCFSAVANPNLPVDKGEFFDNLVQWSYFRNTYIRNQLEYRQDNPLKSNAKKNDTLGNATLFSSSFWILRHSLPFLGIPNFWF